MAVCDASMGVVGLLSQRPDCLKAIYLGCWVYPPHFLLFSMLGSASEGPRGRLEGYNLLQIISSSTAGRDEFRSPLPPMDIVDHLLMYLDLFPLFSSCLLTVTTFPPPPPPPPRSPSSDRTMSMLLLSCPCSTHVATSPLSTLPLTIPTSPYPCVRLLQPSRSHLLPHRLTFFPSDAGPSLSQQRAVLTAHVSRTRRVSCLLLLPPCLISRLETRHGRLSLGLATEEKVSSIDHLNLTHHATLPTPASPILTFISVSSPQRRSSFYPPSPLTLLLLSSLPLRAL